MKLTLLKPIRDPNYQDPAFLPKHLHGFVQALLQQNADPFAEQIVGGLGTQGDIDPFAEEIVGGLGPQINFVASN